MLAAAACVLIAVTASPRERRLILGGPVSHGLLPEDAPSTARAQQLVVSRAPEGS